MSVAVGVPDLQTIGTSYGYTAMGSGTMDLYLLADIVYTYVDTTGYMAMCSGGMTY